MEYISNTQLNGPDILKLFIENGLHTFGNVRINWSQDVVCVCLVTFLNGRNTLLISKNTVFLHAEYKIIRYLKENIQGIRFVKIFCSFSPCSKIGYDCCSLIGKIKEDLKTLHERNRGDGVRSLTFVFSQLYEIARPSCRNRGCFKWGQNGHIRPQESDDSLNNLRSLGRGIRSFEMGDWKVLIGLLALWDTYRCGVPTRMRISFLESFLYGEYGHWRRLEDEHLKRDFQELIASNSHIDAGPINTEHPD